MKTLNWIAWISGCIGVLIIMFAAISLLTGRNMFGFGKVVNYFHAANSFLLITIALFIVVNRCECRNR